MNSVLENTVDVAEQGRVEVRTLTPDMRDRWDQFVESCSEGTFFHRAGWKEVIERAFGHRTFFLYAERDGVMTGVLPLGQVKSRLFGNALISSPFCVYGGAVAEDEDSRSALQDRAKALALELEVDYLEFRNRKPSNADWVGKELYVTFRKSIDPDPDVNLRDIPRKQRAVVRKGIKSGLASEWDGGVERLYRAYSESVRNLGTPVFSKRYFSILREVFGEDCTVLTVSREGELIASVLSFYFRDEVLPYYGGGTSSARHLKGNDFMYWELMRRSAEQGLRWFDYGRSKVGTGSYSFKKNWGFSPEPLHYEYWLVKAKEVPNVSPTNPKYRMFIDTWKRLPLPVTRAVGPWIARNLG